MSGGLLVDLPGLGQLVTTLSEAADRMRAANDRLRSASPADLGSDDLDSAAGDFQDRWEYGIGKISDASGKMTESLQQARRSYEQTEQAISTLFPDPGAPAPEAAANPSSPISRALDGPR